MKQTYHIHEMTCNSCRSHLEESLSNVEGVSKASVNPEKAEFIIEIEPHIPLEKFQETLIKNSVAILFKNQERINIGRLPG